PDAITAGLGFEIDPPVVFHLADFGVVAGDVFEVTAGPELAAHPHADAEAAVFVDGDDEAGVGAAIVVMPQALGHIDVFGVFGGVAGPVGRLPLAAAVGVGREDVGAAMGQGLAQLHQTGDAVAHAVLEVVAPPDGGCTGMREHVGIGQDLVVHDGG